MYISINIYVVYDNKGIAVHFTNCISRYLESPVQSLRQSHCLSFRPGEGLHDHCHRNCHWNCPTNGEIELVGFLGSVPVHLPPIHLLPSPRHFPHPLILFRPQLQRLSTNLLGTLPSLSPLLFFKRFLVQHTAFVSFESSYVLYHYSKGPQQAHQNTHGKLVGLDLSL